MLTLLKNARILSMKENEDIFAGNILVEDNIIKQISKDNINGAFDLVIDCNNNLLMPGFKNAHTHSAMSFARSISDDIPLHQWLNDVIFPMEAKLKPYDLYHLSKVSILEYLSSGITCCFDMYYEPLTFAKACEDMGFRAVLLGTVTKYRESVDEMKQAYFTINSSKDSLVTYQLGFHAEYTANEEILKELSKAAHELKCPIFTHSSESKAEVDGCIQRHGCTPTEYMDKLGLFDYGGGAFHCVYLSENDIRIFKEKNLTIVTNPGSNCKLASGVAPIDRYIKEGINLAIGTDGAGSNNGLDFFYEMRLASSLQKIINNDASAGQALDILKAATIGGAKALRLDNCDILSEGKLADIIMIDLLRPSMQPINNIKKNLVYSGSKDLVKMTMINGQIRYMDGQFFVNQPIDEIYKKAQEITDNLRKN